MDRAALRADPMRRVERIGDLVYTRESVTADLEVHEVASCFEHSNDSDAIAVVDTDHSFGQNS